MAAANDPPAPVPSDRAGGLAPVESDSPRRLLACHCCGQIQHAPTLRSHRVQVLRCARCHTRIAAPQHAPASLALPAALALAALILYPLAMALPVLEITKLGYSTQTTIWSGVIQLLTSGHLIIGIIVLLCSVVIPLAKILGIFILCLTAGREELLHRRHQARTYRAIDWLGRWGMIDVLLVAILVAAVKLGDWVNVHPGPGIIAFAGVVILSLLASLTFDPQSIWSSHQDAARGMKPQAEAPATR